MGFSPCFRPVSNSQGHRSTIQVVWDFHQSDWSYPTWDPSSQTPEAIQSDTKQQVKLSSQNLYIYNIYIYHQQVFHQLISACSHWRFLGSVSKLGGAPNSRRLPEVLRIHSFLKSVYTSVSQWGGVEHLSSKMIILGYIGYTEQNIYIYNCLYIHIYISPRNILMKMVRWIPMAHCHISKQQPGAVAFFRLGLRPGCSRPCGEGRQGRGGCSCGWTIYFD